MSDDENAELVHDWESDCYVLRDEIARLRAKLAAVTAERDRMKEVLKDVVSAAYSTRASIGVPCIDIQVIVRARAAIEGVTEPNNGG